MISHSKVNAEKIKELAEEYAAAAHYEQPELEKRLFGAIDEMQEALTAAINLYKERIYSMGEMQKEMNRLKELTGNLRRELDTYYEVKYD